MIKGGSTRESIECRHCGSRLSRITHTWQKEVNWNGQQRTIVRRRRECHHCGLPYTTVETYERDDKPNEPESPALSTPSLSEPTTTTTPAPSLPDAGPSLRDWVAKRGRKQTTTPPPKAFPPTNPYL